MGKQVIYPVLIYYQNNHKVYKDFDPKGLPQGINDSVMYWLERHCPQGIARTSLRNITYVGEEWSFKDRKTAIRFALEWR